MSDNKSIRLQYFSKHTTIKSKEKINHDRPVRQEREREREQSVFVILGIDGVLWPVFENIYVIRGHGVFTIKLFGKRVNDRG